MSQPLFGALMPFVTAYGPHRKVQVDVDTPPGQDCQGAVQSFKEECDINRIMGKFERTGMLEWEQRHAPQYADVTGLDFSSAMTVVLEAQSMFDDLPAKVRDRFANDPVRFFDFVHDPASKDELVSLGLATAPAVVAEPAPSTTT